MCGKSHTPGFELDPKSWTLLEVKEMSHPLSYEEKVELIRLWKEEDYSIGMLCKHFNCSQSVVERWRKRYLFHGIEGLKGKMTRPPYTKEMKKKILAELQRGHSKKEILAKYQMSHSTLSKWLINCDHMEKFDETKAIAPKEIKNLKNKYKDNPEMLEILKRLEYSEMENACLKKLATLVQARKEKERKQSEN